ncbi:MAG: isochorismatase family protein [Alphaproteobacteria bacterium]|nr:isochorismatase family protein [Alphaproteobacteria bacterium]
MRNADSMVQEPISQKPVHEIVHLAIDVQRKFSKKLSPFRAISFPRKIRDFSDQLRSVGVPTAYVAFDYNLEKRVYPRQADWPMDNPRKRNFWLISSLGMNAVSPKKDEDLILKRDDGAFCEYDLRRVLGKYKTKTLLISGMNTQFCVLASADGAVRKGFDVWIVYDMLADSSGRSENRRDEDPEWHRDSLSRLIEKYPEVKLMRADECLEVLGQRQESSPAQPKRAQLVASLKKSLGF